ncbi:MAG: lytic transglycosylase F [Pseudomonadota bacterium]
MTNEGPLAKALAKPFTGDYEQMKKKRVVRVLISFSYTDYYLDDGKEKGLAAETMREFEQFLNQGVKNTKEKVRIALIPKARDELIPALLAGHGDIAAANLTITSDRKKLVEFSDPVLTGVRELIVTNAAGPKLSEIADLSGMEIHARKSSSYYTSLEAANKTLAEMGLNPIRIVAANEWLEDEDLLEMIDVGIIPAIVMDEHKAELWQRKFKHIRIHNNPALRKGAEVAWAFRKDSPELKAVVNSFVAKVRKGSKLGNIFARRYQSDIYEIVNPQTKKYTEHLRKLAALFEKYAKQYDLDPMLLAAQAFQESRFDNNARSSAGAVGIMQLLPSTALDKDVAIRNFRTVEGSIEAAAKYNRFIADQYFSDEAISEFNKILFVLASYNAGPNRVARVRKNAENPDVWFDHVEWQVARAAGIEPVKYVKNIYIYYLLFTKWDKYGRHKNAK